MITAVFIKAQTMMVNDFESGAGGAYVAWGGSCELFQNPNQTSVNNSANVLKITSTSYAVVGFPVNIPIGKTLKDYSGIRFEAMLLEQDSWIGVQAGVSENTWSYNNVGGYSWPAGTQNIWETIEIAFNESTLENFVNGFTSGSYNVMIKLGRESRIYAVDNVRLIEKEVVSDHNMIFTFESMDLGVSPRCEAPWSGSCTVVENSYTTGLNTSTKSLQIVGVDNSPVTFSDALPTGKTWSDYVGLNFQLSMTDNNPQSWKACEIGVRLDNGSHVKIGAAYDDLGNETAAFGSTVPGEWFNISLKIKEELITELANTTSKMFIRVMGTNFTYLVDNFILVPKSTGPVSELEKYYIERLKVSGAKGFVKISVFEKSQVSVYTIDGKKIYDETCDRGEHYINLNPGIYLVNNNKAMVY